MDLKIKEKYILNQPETISEQHIEIASKRRIGSVIAFYKNTGSKKLQEMFYTTVEERRSAIKKLTAIWGGYISFFQIYPGKRRPKIQKKSLP